MEKKSVDGKRWGINLPSCFSVASQNIPQMKTAYCWQRRSLLSDVNKQCLARAMLEGKRGAASC